MKLEELGTFIHNKREEAGIPLAKAAQKAGIGRSTLWILESGRNPKTGKPSRPSKDKLERLARVLHLSQDELDEALAFAGYQITNRPQQSSNHTIPTFQRSSAPPRPSTPPAATITEVNGTVYLAANGYLQAFDAGTGNHLWSSPTSRNLDSYVTRDVNTFDLNEDKTVEHKSLLRDEFNKAVAALKEYVSVNENSTRNGRILSMVLFEGYTIEKTAQKVRCSVHVVDHVVHSAQRHVSESLGLQRQALYDEAWDLETSRELVRT